MWCAIDLAVRPSLPLTLGLNVSLSVPCISCFLEEGRLAQRFVVPRAGQSSYFFWDSPLCRCCPLQQVFDRLARLRCRNGFLRRSRQLGFVERGHFALRWSCLSFSRTAPSSGGRDVASKLPCHTSIPFTADARRTRKNKQPTCQAHPESRGPVPRFARVPSSRRPGEQYTVQMKIVNSLPPAQRIARHCHPAPKRR